MKKQINNLIEQLKKQISCAERAKEFMIRRDNKEEINKLDGKIEAYEICLKELQNVVSK